MSRVSAADLVPLFSADRLGRYERACRGGTEQAIRLYAWNVEASSALWGGFSVLEVTLRNAIHTELAAIAGHEDWWNGTVVPLHPFERKRVRDAVNGRGTRCRRRRPAAV